MRMSSEQQSAASGLSPRTEPKATKVFADDRAALQAWYAAGGNRDAEVWSSAPALILSDDIDVQAVDACLDRAAFKHLSATTRQVSKQLYDAVLAETNLHRLAVFVARHPTSNQNLLCKAKALTDNDLSEPVAIVTVETGNATTDRVLNTRWRDLLSTNTAATVFTRQADIEDHTAIVEDSLASLMTRLKFESWKSIAYRVALAAGRKAPFLSPRGIVYTGHESALMKEAAVDLALHGYAIRPLPAVVLEASESVRTQAHKVLEQAAPIYRDYLRQHLSPAVVDGVSKILFPDLEARVTQFLAYLDHWREHLRIDDGKRVRGAVFGFPSAPRELAFAEAAAEAGLISASFQHGIARELCKGMLDIDTLYENTITDHFFAYNAESARRSAESPFGIATIHPVGLPHDLSRGAARLAPDPDAAPILYVSTVLNTGNMQIPMRLATRDYDKSLSEIRLVANIFSQLPHRVTYKTYPVTRSLDPDPVHVEIGRHDNMTLNDDRIDLRYIVGRSRVIVTSRATSTIGWCLMSKRPVVYIDREDSRLFDEARSDFEQTGFYFDMLEPGFEDRLREFLSKPVEEIEALWEISAPARTQFLKKYFGSTDGHAGNRAAAILLAELTKGKPAL